MEVCETTTTGVPNIELYNNNSFGDPQPQTNTQRQQELEVKQEVKQELEEVKDSVNSSESTANSDIAFAFQSAQNDRIVEEPSLATQVTDQIQKKVERRKSKRVSVICPKQDDTSSNLEGEDKSTLQNTADEPETGDPVMKAYLSCLTSALDALSVNHQISDIEQACDSVTASGWEQFTQEVDNVSAQIVKQMIEQGLRNETSLMPALQPNPVNQKLDMFIQNKNEYIAKLKLEIASWDALESKRNTVSNDIQNTWRKGEESEEPPLSSLSAKQRTLLSAAPNHQDLFAYIKDTRNYMTLLADNAETKNNLLIMCETVVQNYISEMSREMGNILQTSTIPKKDCKVLLTELLADAE